MNDNFSFCSHFHWLNELFAKEIEQKFGNPTLLRAADNFRSRTSLRAKENGGHFENMIKKSQFFCYVPNFHMCRKS